MEHNILKELYKQSIGSEATQITELPRSGSNRQYFRLNGNKSIIGAIGNNPRENEAFIYMANHFHANGLNTPQLLAVSEDGNSYIQEDLGDMSLFTYIKNGRETGKFSEEEIAMLVKTIRRLPDIQFKGAIGMDFSKCFPASNFSNRSILWDLNYFKYCFLKATGIEFDEDALENDFNTMCDVLHRSESATFMYRDFQSRNVLIKDGEPWFIDFQGGRKGPFFYDVASFLWQAKANFPDALRNKLINEYIDALRVYKPVDEQYFKEQLRHFVLFRTLQVLGAYGFRGYFEKKPHFMQSVPFAINNLRELIKTPFTEYPYLNSLLKELVGLKQFAEMLEQKTLTVKVMSFAYKKNLPTDTSGNGGGFIFDCRAINNPGKYDRYKPFTGLDANVIKFLEEESTIGTFLDHAYALVDASVKRYIERGFTNLMVCFGCTGGQHRSVYCAQHMAEHINSKFNVKVELVHREQNIEQTFHAK